MTPLEFLARLAALVPPPRYPLVRYHGVLAPRSPWRRDIVPRARESVARASARPSAGREGRSLPSRALGTTPKRASPTAGPAPLSPRSAAQTPAPERTEARAESERHAPLARPRNGADEAVRSGSAIVLAPNVLAVKHWNRLLGGQLYAATPRVDWATLLRRSFEVDVLRCSQCGGRLRVLGEVTEPTMIRLVLESLGMPTEAPRPARARDPTDLLGDPDAEG